MAEPTPFPILRLPKELRLIIYDHLPIRITHVIFEHTIVNGWIQAITLVVKTVPGLALLTISKFIHADASPILNRKLLAIKRSPVQIIMPMTWFLGGLVFFDGLSDITNESIISDTAALHEAVGDDRLLFQFLRHAYLNTLVRRADRELDSVLDPEVYDGVAGPEIHVAVHKDTKDHARLHNSSIEECNICFCDTDKFVGHFVKMLREDEELGAYVVARPILEEGDADAGWMGPIDLIVAGRGETVDEYDILRHVGGDGRWDITRGADLGVEEFGSMWEVGDGLSI
jgi:hypothetical protein